MTDETAVSKDIRQVNPVGGRTSGEPNFPDLPIILARQEPRPPNFCFVTVARQFIGGQEEKQRDFGLRRSLTVLTKSRQKESDASQ
jgi:hypothetical protein